MYHMQGWLLAMFCAESDTSWQVNGDNAGRLELLRNLVLVSSYITVQCRTSSYTLLSALILPERLPLLPKPLKLVRL